VRTLRNEKARRWIGGYWRARLFAREVRPRLQALERAAEPARAAAGS
jgi:hypothetical protein